MDRPRAADCVFCKIVAGEIPSRQVYADDAAVAFLDVAPFERGHTLVVPRGHVDSLLDPAAAVAELGPAIDTTSRLLVERLHAEGLNLISSAGPVAGQEVFHLHVHLVPRYAARPGLRELFERGGHRSAEAEEQVLDEVHRRLVGPPQP